MTAACPRRFEVEALRDGRLSGAELSRFQVHLGVCADCAREAHALQSLAERLRAPSHADDVDELHVRRERTRLLAAFDESLVPTPRASRSPLWLGAATGVLVLAVVGFVLWSKRPAPPSPALANAPEPITIRADSSATWSRHREAGLDKVVLETGALSIRVDHTTAQHRLLVILPDGELEDIGTTFSVSAAGGRTTRVTVQDGSVVLRLRGTPPLALGAGDSWSLPPAPAPAPAPIASSPPAPPSAAAPATPDPRRPARVPSLATGQAVARVASDADPSTAFRAALSAFNSGDNATAAARFTVFLAQHSKNPRAEDAAYLRILALQRAGNAAATRQAAHDYLARHPAGFRRAEAEALAR